MKKAAGIAIIHKKKILLVHPTNSVWEGTWGIPKGQVENNEDIIDAAIRETFEEIGVSITRNMLSECKTIDYIKKDKIYKKVFYFICRIKDLETIGVKEDSLETSQLQLDEVDKAEFFDYNRASELIFWRQKEILDFIK